MIVGLEKRFGIRPLWTLVILGAESSLGDPDLGGELARRNNFGCIKAAAQGPWSELANDTIDLRGTLWHAFPNPALGMEAWGLYITQGAGGVYPALLEEGDWRGFAPVYYGADVPRFKEYVAELCSRATGVRAKAKAAGFDW